MMNEEQIIEKLGLEKHPEGGWYKETFFSKIKIKNRSISSMIYYLLKKGETSHWHRVKDADEIWNWHLGGSLELSFAHQNISISSQLKGTGDGVGADVASCVSGSDVDSRGSGSGDGSCSDVAPKDGVDTDSSTISGKSGNA